MKGCAHSTHTNEVHYSNTGTVVSERFKGLYPSGYPLQEQHTDGTCGNLRSAASKPPASNDQLK